MKENGQMINQMDKVLKRKDLLQNIFYYQNFNLNIFVSRLVLLQ